MGTWTVGWITPSVTFPRGEGLWGAEELFEREARAGIRPGSPFMTSPNGDVDAVLTAYFSSPRFARLAESSKRSYCDDYRTFFTFLWQRDERRWQDATVRDIEDYEDWRRRAPENPRTISGAKWAREVAALKRLYEWAVGEHLLAASPIRTMTLWRRDGRQVAAAEVRATDVRSVDMKWLTPRMAHRWRDVGLMGLTTEGLFDSSFRGRMGDRNAAYFDLLFDSGLRRTEGASLLSMEVPRADVQSRYLWGRVATAVAKYGSGRPFPVTDLTVSRIRAYEQTSRAAAVAAAQDAGRYDAIANKRIVERVRESGMGATIRWVEQSTGEVREAPLDRLGVTERALLFTRTDEGLEPMWFWLSESGLPFQSHSWEEVFAAASRRCARVLGDAAPFCTPHMARHSFALIMLVALHHIFDNRYGLDAEQRRDYALLYGDPWRMVKDLLGHKSVETTRNVYLAPVRDVQIRTLLEGDTDYGTEFLHALAAASREVQDVRDG